MDKPINLRDASRIIKYGGHCFQRRRSPCYDGCGWTECHYWQHDQETGYSVCLLFPQALKLSGKSLTICNKVYGFNYEGEA